ncbi:MAG: hypothetical protein ACOX6T_09545 [Myxococcales bacterium]
MRAFFDPTLVPKRGNAAATWLAYPFPADHRRLADGNVRLSDFPNPDAVSLLTSYVKVGEADLDGFGTNSAVHVAFDGPLDTSSIPTDPSAFLSSSAAMQLIDITPDSPEYGVRRPLRWEYWAKSGRYVYKNSLAVAPAWGFPLRERTTYALILTNAVQGADGNPLRAPELLRALLTAAPDAPAVKPEVPAELYSELLEQFAPLRARLAADAIDPASVALATVFTTQDITGLLAVVREQIARRPTPALQSWSFPREAAGGLYFERSFTWSSNATVSYYVMEGSFDSWNYQNGEIPYAVEGGGFNLVDGVPTPARTDRLRFVLTFPKNPPAGGGCFPIVEVAHGTGGDAYSFFDDETAGRLAARGLAGVGLDQPLHGARMEGKDFDVDMMSFNYMNPESSRANFRQSAIDTFVLTKLLKKGFKVEAASSPTGREICFDTERIGFFGHSHGGLTGAIAAGIEHGVQSWMFSGAGGGLAITVTERKDIVDVHEAITYLLGLGGDEPLSETHPVMTLIQTLVDATDPINYAPYWNRDATFGEPSNVMLTSGLHDEQTPYRTANALALAGRLPPIEPLPMAIPGYAWAGMQAQKAPVSGNANGATAGFLQWGRNPLHRDYDSHFLIFYRPEAIDASMRFLRSGVVDGVAVIERNPSSDAR